MIQTVILNPTQEFGGDGRRVEADFAGGDMTSNGGVLLLRAADRFLGLTAAVARGLVGPRRGPRIRHSLLDQLRQRVYGIALGYEDLNYHDALRHDLAPLQLASTAFLACRPVAKCCQL